MSSDVIAGIKLCELIALRMAATQRHARDQAGADALENMAKILRARRGQESQDPTAEVPVIAVCARCGGPSVCVSCGGPV